MVWHKSQAGTLLTPVVFPGVSLREEVNRREYKNWTLCRGERYETVVLATQAVLMDNRLMVEVEYEGQSYCISYAEIVQVRLSHGSLVLDGAECLCQTPLRYEYN